MEKLNKSIERPFSELAREVDARLNSFIGELSELDWDKFLEIASEVLFQEFRGDRQVREPEFFVAEAVAIATYSRVETEKGYKGLGPLGEIIIRSDIRQKLNELENKANS